MGSSSHCTVYTYFTNYRSARQSLYNYFSNVCHAAPVMYQPGRGRTCGRIGLQLKMCWILH